MVTTANAAIARRVRRLRAHGMEVRYFHEEIGWNSRLDTLQAAVLLVKLRHVEEWNSAAVPWLRARTSCSPLRESSSPALIRIAAWCCPGSILAPTTSTTNT